jgi:hypothetical protein
MRFVAGAIKKSSNDAASASQRDYASPKFARRSDRRLDFASAKKNGPEASGP